MSSASMTGYPSNVSALPTISDGCHRNAPSVVLNLRNVASVREFITQLAPWRYGARRACTRSTRRSCGFEAANAPAAPDATYCNVPNGRVVSVVMAVGNVRKPFGRLTPVPPTNAAPSARANSVAISPDNQASTSNAASSSMNCDAAGLAYKSPIGGTISLNTGVPVSGRAETSVAQPDATPFCVTNFR